MLKNYFKIAIAVLLRRKFFTFISLFGISFTLTILMVLTAFSDHLLSAGYPELKRDQSLYISAIRQKHSKQHFQTSGSASFYFLNHYAGSLKTVSKVAISSMFTPTNAYLKNKKLSLNIKYTNADFWQVMDYTFLEGKPYSKQQIQNAELVTVISEDTKRNYFGDIGSVTGKYIEADNVRYRVTGVVKSVPVTFIHSYGDLFVPYTLSKTDYRNKAFMGGYTAVLLADSKSDFSKIKSEYNTMMAKVKPDSKEFDQLDSSVDTYFESFARNFDEGGVSGSTIVIVTISIFIFLFMLLPTINLININISRIMERSSEIGVRKAFGASSKTLVYQFIIENLILTLIGGLIGIVFSFVIIQFINASTLLPNAELSINLAVLFYSIITCLLFGLLSGVYPAWRMSRLHIVTALKAQ